MSNDNRFRPITRFAFAADNVPTEEWRNFVIPILNKAEWDLPDNQRLGQRVMNALGELHPQFFNAIAGTEFDIWELDTTEEKPWKVFWDRLFELFVHDI